jgi:hypothetical protein
MSHFRHFNSSAVHENIAKYLRQSFTVFHSNNMNLDSSPLNHDWIIYPKMMVAFLQKQEYFHP